MADEFLHLLKIFRNFRKTTETSIACGLLSFIRVIIKDVVHIYCCLVLEGEGDITAVQDWNIECFKCNI